MVENRKVSRSQIQGLEDKIERSNYDYFKLKKKERKESYSTIKGMARLDCELMVTNVLECELPEEGRTRRAHTIFMLPHVWHACEPHAGTMNSTTLSKIKEIRFMYYLSIKISILYLSLK